MKRKFLLLLVCYLLFPVEIFGAALIGEEQPTKYFCGYKLKATSGINDFALLNHLYDHKDVTYMITDYTDKLSNTDIDNIITQAFNAWAAVTDLRFTRIHSGEADVVVRFVVGDHGDGFPFDGSGNVLAHAYYGFAHFDDSENWSTHLDSGITNLYSVAVHEIGHVLGLDHSDIPKTMMYPSYDPYNVVMQLHGDDINGIQKLYCTNTECQSQTALESLSAQACEGSTLNIICYDGLIDVLSANYGRQSKSECNSDGQAPIRTLDCVSKPSVYIVEAKCQNHRRCSIQVNNDVFGDPCHGTFKYLSVEYRCNISTPPIKNAVACESSNLDIKCEPGERIFVVGATYGRTSKSICNKGGRAPIRTDQCSSENSEAIIHYECSNKTQCTISAANSVFGDPCEGTYKYLEVDYKCSKA